MPPEVTIELEWVLTFFFCFSCVALERVLKGIRSFCLKDSMTSNFVLLFLGVRIPQKKLPTGVKHFPLCLLPGYSRMFPGYFGPELFFSTGCQPYDNIFNIF